MTEPVVDALTRRLDLLERENRRWRYGGALVLLTLASALVMGQALPNRRLVEAEKFVLRDSQGKIRAVLGAESRGVAAPTIALSGTGQYGLHMYGADGAYRAALREDDSAAWELDLRAKGTPSRASLVVADGYVGFNLTATEQSHDATDRESAEWGKRFNAAKTDSEREKLLLGRKINNVQAGLWAFSKGTSGLKLKHGMGGGLDFYLLRQQSALYISDEKDTSRVIVGQAKLEHTATGVVEERPTSSVVLLDKDGKAIWRAP